MVEAYSPLGNNIYSLPMAIEDSVITELAEGLGQTPAQVILSWVVQRGIVALTKSVTPSRIKSNLQGRLAGSPTDSSPGGRRER